MQAPPSGNFGVEVRFGQNAGYPQKQAVPLGILHVPSLEHVNILARNQLIVCIITYEYIILIL